MKEHLLRGGEQYLTIGFFDENIDTLFVQNTLGFYFHPYYYVDSVSLYEIGVSSELCDFHIDVPNVFTPNNDGVNDIINISDFIEVIDEMYILNRWGNIITVLSENNPVWNGNNCSDGVYYYIIKFLYYDKQQSGFIHLMR